MSVLLIPLLMSALALNSSFANKAVRPESSSHKLNSVAASKASSTQTLHAASMSFNGVAPEAFHFVAT